MSTGALDVISVGDIVTDAFIKLFEDKAVTYETEKGKWQFISIGLPIVLVLLFGFIYQAIRKRKYQ